MKQQENKKTFFKEIIGIVDECMLAFLTLLTAHYLFLNDVRRVVDDLYYRATVTSGLLSITIYDGIQKHRIFNVELIPLIAIFIGLILIRNKIKIRLKEDEAQDEG